MMVIEVTSVRSGHKKKSGCGKNYLWMNTDGEPSPSSFPFIFMNEVYERWAVYSR